MRPRLARSAEGLVFHGLRTHCFLFSSDYRLRHNHGMNLEELYEGWLVKSLTAFSQLQGYDKDNQRIRQLIFKVVFEGEVEPTQTLIGLGWWRRLKNRNKFRNLFESGILLGMLYDIKSKELATQEAEELAVSPSCTLQK